MRVKYDSNDSSNSDDGNVKGEVESSTTTEIE